MVQIIDIGNSCSEAKMGRLSKEHLILLLVLPMVTEATGFNQDYTDYNDRIIINPGTEPLDYAAIYEGVFSYENIIIMQIQNLITFACTALAWALIQAIFPPRLASRVKREGEEVNVDNDNARMFSDIDIAALIHTVGDAVEKYSSKA